MNNLFGYMEKERLSWDGRKTADFFKISNDGLYEWNGFEWQPRKKKFVEENSTSEKDQQEELQQEDRELTRVPAQDLKPLTNEVEFKVGSISKDGYHQWDGKKWIPVELATVSEDGFWIWDGTKWVPNRTTNSHRYVIPMAEKTQNSQFVNYQIHAQNSPTIFIPQQKKSNNVLVSLASVIVISVAIVIIAIMIILSSALYVWASSLAEEPDQTNLIGTWYNTEDTITFYPNGTVVETTNTITRWNSQGHNLTTTFLIDEDEVDVVWKYEIQTDSDNDKVLFMAYYDLESGNQSNEIAENSCIIYIDSVQGTNEDYYEGKLALIPDWCEF